VRVFGESTIAFQDRFHLDRVLQQDFLLIMSAVFKVQGQKAAHLHKPFDQGEQLLKTLSKTLGLPWRSVEEFDSDTLVGAVERVVIKPDDIEMVMKYKQAANG